MARSFRLIACLAWLCSCTSFAPPPLMMHQSETIFRSEPGAVNLGGFVGLGVAGFPFGDAFFGGQGVADILAPAGWKFGVSGAAGTSSGTVKAGRVFAQYRPPGQDLLAFHVGGSSGTFSLGDLSLRYAGPDLGVSIGQTFGTVRPYFTASGSFSQPFAATGPGPGQATAASDPWTQRVYYAQAALGVCAMTPVGVELAAELNVAHGWEANGPSNTPLSLTAGVRYRFGKAANDLPLSSDTAKASE